VGLVMLAKCTNPSCSAEFRYLHEGTLFRLVLDSAVRPPEVKATEYFWLCGGCSATLTLRLGEDGTVIAVPLPHSVGGDSEEKAFVAGDRKNGWMLHKTGLLLSGQFGYRVGVRLRDEDRVA